MIDIVCKKPYPFYTTSQYTADKNAGYGNLYGLLLLIYDELQFYPERLLRHGSNYVICKINGLTIDSEETRFAELLSPFVDGTKKILQDRIQDIVQIFRKSINDCSKVTF